ncbi:alpha-1,2-fucosyltransferase [Polynucleobacter asymbioticus]|nr:alpha-1,2-fucosyltransferase [Polynucleobacter asymbioticus]
MIIFLGNGRLGNQLFQYSYLKKEFPGERVILIGFDDVAELCEMLNTLVIPQKYFGKIAYRFFRGAIALLGLSRLISSIQESPSSSEFKLTKKYGIFSKIILIRDSFFQHELFTNSLPLNLEIKTVHQKKAQFLITQIATAKPGRELIFVHIRRGDYVQWPSARFPAVLPAKWIEIAMGYFKNKLKTPIFLVFTDDRPYALDIFLGKEDIVIMDSENPATDLVTMSLCNFGILSASTFSWWAANLSRGRLGNGLNYEFIGPQYWVGHSQGQWFPPNFYSQWLTYLLVDN